VSIPSYRDPELPHTIRTCLANADRPDCVRIFALAQDSDLDPDPAAESRRVLRRSGIKDKTVEELLQSVTVARLPASQARGAPIARAMIEKQILAEANNSDFVLMVDSHTLFLRGWDSYLRDEILKCGSKQAILSTYPFNYNRGDREKILKLNREAQSHCSSEHAMESGTFMTIAGFLPADDSALPRYDSRPFAQIPETPYKSLAWAACLSFAPVRAHRQVPYVNWPDVHFGEEHAMHARFHTAGWTVYHPTRMPMLTHFDRSYRPIPFGAHDEPDVFRRRRAEGFARVRRALGLDGATGRPECDLGKRPLDEVHALLGVVVPQERQPTVALSRAAGLVGLKSKHEMEDKYGSPAKAAERLEELSNTSWVDASNQAAEVTATAKKVQWKAKETPAHVTINDDPFYFA